LARRGDRHDRYPLCDKRRGRLISIGDCRGGSAQRFEALEARPTSGLSGIPVVQRPGPEGQSLANCGHPSSTLLIAATLVCLLLVCKGYERGRLAAILVADMAGYSRLVE
jgi:hypothetical protein